MRRGRTPRGDRGGRKGGEGRRSPKTPKSLADLDKELDAYLKDEPAGAKENKDGGADVTMT